MIKISNDMLLLQEKKVLYIVNKYAQNHNREDLIQAGRMGVIKAAENFDDSQGVKFSTFCEKYILGEVLKYIREDKNIRVSRDFIRLKRKIDIAREGFLANTLREPTVEELSILINEDVNKISEALNINQNVRSIDESIDNSENLTLADTISQEEAIDRIDLINLNDALSSLEDSDRKIIEERYYNGKTQTELAKEMNISQVKVYRLERKILDNLNDKLAA